MPSRFRWPLLLTGAALAAVLFVVFRSGNDEKTASIRGTTTTPTASGIDIAVTIEDGKPVGGIATATVKQGEKVALVVHSDVADEVHLHGYDLHSDVEAGGTATISFTANIAGRFEAELEDRQEQILSLTVEP